MTLAITLFDKLYQRDYTIEFDDVELTSCKYYGSMPDTIAILFEAVDSAIQAWREIYKIPEARIGRELVVKSLIDKNTGDIIYLDTYFDWSEVD